MKQTNVTVTLSPPPLPPESERRFAVEQVGVSVVCRVRDRTTGEACCSFHGESGFTPRDAAEIAEALERADVGLPGDRVIFLWSGNEWVVLALLPPWTNRALLAEAIKL